MRKRCSIQQGEKKITVDQSKVLKNQLFHFFWATRYKNRTLLHLSWPLFHSLSFTHRPLRENMAHVQGEAHREKEDHRQIPHAKPVYNESFVFNIPLDRIRETTFVLSVIDKDRLSKNDMIGGILLGARASPPEMSHWNEMMSKPRTNIAKWHVLKGMN